MNGHKGPLGFLYAGVASGVRVKRPDLALLFCEVDAVAAGCFTRSRARAAAVDRSPSLVPSVRIRAVVVNSGNANALTGPEGAEADRRMAEAIARALGVSNEAVLTCSTGIMGVPLPVAKIEAATPALVERLGPEVEPFAEAIHTTDRVQKIASRELFVGGDCVRVLGVAKGSGMVHPNLGTVLAFLLTDAVITPDTLDTLLRWAVDGSFHLLSVDGDSSTNDTALALASGLAENEPITSADSPSGQVLGAALLAVAQDLARAVAADGEGARHLIT
ncbi:MAG: bifunctional ornithine acetyltransferase/N-acetylglutamate synthase, partial [Myxococcales bacterium]|nr:bifunctional ornithine acetyltransferase/N-acetylglutamate synthase [Polyangiaceae bacterium]MDW8250266.1 bifunctional ornithine acetyltransferase/N-acetylglutamate synthase [Myxococcales bacterium]